MKFRFTMLKAMRSAAWCALLSAAPAIAQMNTAEAGGEIQDQLGGQIPGATVVAEQASTGQKFSTASNQAGAYLFPALPVGIYTIRVNAPSFRQSVLPPFEAHAGERLKFNFTLQVGDASDTVTVEAGAEGPQADSAEIKDTVQGQQVVGLPVESRQYLDLAMYSPGVVRPPGGTRGDALQQAGTLINVLGQRSGHNLYLLDGVTITDEDYNNMVVAPSIDGIAEMNIQKTSYAPEFGGKSGAVINVISKSGSNDFHGDLLEFVRNDAWDAKNFFDSHGAPIPPFHQNQFGGAGGGPIAKNRTFFFLSYEGQRVRKSLTQTFSVPTPALREGNFAGLAAIYDPLSATSSGARQPFPNNVIPAQELDPVATALLANVALPNLLLNNPSGLGQNQLAAEEQKIDTNAYSARIDHRISGRDTAFARASVFDAREFDPFGSGVLQETLLPGFGRDLSTHTVNGSAQWTHAFSPEVLNEVRFGYMSVVGGQQSPNAGNNFAARTGLQGATANPADLGYPQASFGGEFTTMGDPALFTFRDNNDFELYDNVTVSKGRHTLKFGAYYMHYELNTANPNNARGTFSFTPHWTSSAVGLTDGNAFADFLLGDPTSAQGGIGRAAMDGKTNWGHLYAQDSWQITPNLKADIGLRYEYNQNMTDSQNRIAAIDSLIPGGEFVIASNGPGQISPLAGALLPLIPVPYTSSAAMGWSNSLLAQRPLRLAPRAGLAWNLPHAKTALRASFGIYPNQASYSIITNLAQNLPFFVTKTVNSNSTALLPAFDTENALTASSLGTVGGSDANHNFQVEYNEVWNFTAEREVGTGTYLSASYVGSRTVHADSSTVLNVPLPGPGAIAARRPIPQLSQFNTIRWDGWASFNALTLAARRRVTKGLMFDANWTWSHSIDDASDPGATLNENNLPQNVYNTQSEKASSSFDHRQRLVVSFVYQIPGPTHGDRFARAILSRWQVAGNYTVQTGAPFTVNISSDQANIGSGPAQRPNVRGNPNDGPRSPNEWFNTAAFSLPALYTFGDSPRNAVIGPGLREFDMALQREIPITDRVRIQLRGEGYNLLNHPNFNIPNRIAFTQNFGQISSAQDSRQLQLAMKLTF